MVRRRSSKSKDTKPGPRPVHKKDGKIKRWNKPSDIPLDEEDHFHASRDHILLDGDDRAPEDDDDGEEEVFALKGMPQSDSEQSEEEEDGEDEDVDMEDVEEEEPPQKKAAKAKGKRASRQDPAPDGASDKSDDEEEEEGWGHKKSAYYSTNAEELDSEDDEANELEEQEARRLQSKSRDVMNEDDFGMGDVAEPDLLDDPVEDILADAPPKVETQPLPKDKASILRHLEKTSPETLALANDWDDVAHKLLRSQEKLKQLESDEPDSLSLGMVHLHYQTLLTYATTLAFYLHLRAGEKYAQRPELLRAHPVFARLLQLKQALSTLEDLDFDLSSSDAGSGDEDDEDEDLYIDDDEFSDFMDEDGGVAGAGERARAFGSGRGALKRDFEQLTWILREAEEDAAPATPNGPERAHPKKKDGKAKSRSDLARGGGGSELPAGGPPKKKRKTDAAHAARVFDLVEPEFVSSARKSGSGGAPSADGAADAYGEAAALAAADAEDKSARRKTLRFHTAKIESASARRRGARAALGGDDDVPYRERRQAREARAAREAAARGLGTGGADLDGEEPQPRSRDEGRDGDGSAEEEAADGYYDLVKRKKQERKEEKQAAYDAAKAASMPSLDDDAEAGGPRALTRAILKNRGLTPHRSKSVRNPRVKKRQKFDKAKKVLASQKAVFKGGDASRYEGERTGISTVVKSVRF